MSNINKDTIIQQCADGYRTASGTSAPVKYGELGELISALSNEIEISNITYNNDNTVTITEGDGTTTHTLTVTYTDGALTELTYDDNAVTLSYDVNGNLTVLGDTPIDVSGYAGQETLDNTVKFVVEDNTYQIVSVNAGAAVAAVTDPTKTDLHFAGWHDSEGATIVFPYTPTSDITLTAHFVFGREGMVLTEANKTICRLLGRRYYKANSGWAIAGYAYIGGFTFPVLVALSSAAADVTAEGYESVGVGGSFVYHDITYYYPGSGFSMDGDRISDSTDVTDLYKCTESTMEAAALTLLRRYLYEI